MELTSAYKDQNFRAPAIFDAKKSTQDLFDKIKKGETPTKKDWNLTIPKKAPGVTVHPPTTHDVHKVVKVG